MDLSEITVPRTYTITLEEDARLDHLSKQTGRNKSELVRQAINDLFEKETAQEPAAQPTA